MCLSPVTFSYTGVGLDLGGVRVGFQQTEFVTGEYSEGNGRMSKVDKRCIIMNGHGILSYRQINFIFSTPSLLV